MKHITPILLTLAALSLTGCCGPRGTSANAEIKPYIGQTDPMAKVVDDINANNSKVPTLWAHHYYEADIVDDKKQSHHVSGDGHLLYISPSSMRLTATAIVGTVFEIGSNKKTYWLKTGPDTGDTMWWGTYADLAKMNPDQIAIPIRPDMVMDVLGVGTIDTNFNTLPAPTMRFDPYADAYVFVWNAKLPDRWISAREVWYDRQTKLPKLVLIYDTNGRVVLRAEFNNPKRDLDGRPQLEMKYYRQLAMPGIPRGQWPWVPGNYNLTFPETGSHLNFTVDEAELKHQEGKIALPDPRSFTMPSVEHPDVSKVIQIGP